MLALQGANNETGIIQPVAEAAALVHAAGGIVVCDAVQLAGRAPCAAAALGADFLILSAHKIGGPKGVGALIAASPDIGVAEPLVRGGGQERGLRAGTENVAGIAGFGAAARAAMAGTRVRAGAPRQIARRPRRPYRDRRAGRRHFWRRSSTACPTPSVSPSLALARRRLVIALDLAGIAVSSGAACSSGKVARSHVLDAMRVDPALGAGAVRLSLGWSSDEADVAHFGEAFAGVASRLTAGPPCRVNLQRALAPASEKIGECRMLDHIGFSVSDVAASRAFYAAALAPLGIGVLAEFGDHIGFGRDGRAQFWFSGGGKPAGRHASRLHRQKPRRSERFLRGRAQSGGQGQWRAGVARPL